MPDYTQQNWDDGSTFTAAQASEMSREIKEQEDYDATQDATIAGLSTQVINPQSNTTYTFAANDAGKLVTGSNASAITWTIPPNSTVPIAVGKSIDILQMGAGAITVAAGAGVTLRSRGGAVKTNGQYAPATLIKIATDEWLLTGDITT